MTHLRTLRGRGLQAASAVLVTISMILLGAAALPASATTTTSKAASQSVSHSQAPQQYSAPVTGTTEDGRSVTGTFTPSKFQVMRGADGKRHLMVSGMLRGQIENGRSFQRQVAMEVQNVQAGGGALGGARMAGAAAGECQILNLDLGPLDLNLLGLKVHLDKVVLDITAQPGQGQLLGNLLCAVAGLLDNTGGGGLGGLLGQLNTLLNQILAALGNL